MNVTLWNIIFVLCNLFAHCLFRYNVFALYSRCRCVFCKLYRTEDIEYSRLSKERYTNRSNVEKFLKNILNVFQAELFTIFILFYLVLGEFYNKYKFEF